MGNTIKLVSGFILFVIGVLIAYETSVYNLLDILLIVGLIISIVGVILIVSYFVDSNADKTTNMIKEFLESGEISSPSFGGFERKNDNKSNGPLKVRRDFNEYDDVNYEDLVIEEYPDAAPKEYYDDVFEDNPKAVLNVVQREERDVDFDKQLVFTPHYGKPLKVTRSPKRRQTDYFVEEIPPFVVENDKSDEIRRALSEEPVIEEPVSIRPEVVAESVPDRDIKIDINNPESLPVPSSLKSFVISDSGLLTSQEAFEQLANTVRKEIMLEIPSLNDLSDKFLSHVPTSYSRVIIDEFDVSDMSYMFLISSLLKQGVHIRTVPKVHSVNLITDDSHAMIISDGASDVEYGAVYDDRNSISSIRANFEKTWNIASNLDENIIMGVSGGSA
ncbi:hypothetical protein TL18_07555 [Methanobrevibacter sp. YE315]|uniref:hypothetical protein n=1 Tax=Methanobrevibacter sp. YE315 TaxID=1609968 RepID=UPI000764E765|nr:hypothetical protein [Methanobrevibacter sp. YE315]AMD17892.1 hypothetical protein TL18_07555 [Methanobrevibacter sp. YE315]